MTPTLVEAGHTVHPLTLPGLESRESPRAGIGLRTHIDAVIEKVDSLEGKVVLVGHSGGGAIILGHLEIVDHVHITAATVISRSIMKPGQYSGMFPFDDNAAWEKNAATLRQLYQMRERLRALEKKT